MIRKKASAKILGNNSCITNCIRMFNNWQSNTKNISFLKSICSNKTSCNLSGNNNKGIESILAFAIPVTKFVAPGPEVAKQTPTLFVTLA